MTDRRLEPAGHGAPLTGRDDDRALVRAWSGSRAEDEGAPVPAREDGAVAAHRAHALSGSVIVCARDGARFLRRCLESLEHQLPTPHGFEILVVDIGAPQHERGFLSQWIAADPSRRRVVRGAATDLRDSRDAGVATARGDVVLFLDDHAIAPRGWVAAHLRAYDVCSAAPDGVGGPVVLTWPDGRPTWATARLDHWWGALDLGDERRLFPSPHQPGVGNMSIKKRTLLELSRPRSCSGAILAEQGAALWARVRADGGRILYEPAALVVQQVAADRLQRRWILRQGWTQGRTEARLLALDGPRDMGSVLRSCRLDWRRLRYGAGQLARSTTGGEGTSSDVLDDVARRGGHASAIVEHIRLRVLDGLDREWR